ncbi:MAG: hypothetical protein AAF533_24750 [Acidobacteriota bacterium]
MKDSCRDLREALAKGNELDGLQLLHLEGCDDCVRVRSELSTLDERLQRLGEEMPPDDLAERTRRRIEAAATTDAALKAGTEPEPWWPRPWLWAPLASLVLICVAFFLLPRGMTGGSAPTSDVARESPPSIMFHLPNIPTTASRSVEDRPEKLRVPKVALPDPMRSAPEPLITMPSEPRDGMGGGGASRERSRVEVDDWRAREDMAAASPPPGTSLSARQGIDRSNLVLAEELNESLSEAELWARPGAEDVAELRASAGKSGAEGQAGDWSHPVYHASPTEEFFETLMAQVSPSEMTVSVDGETIDADEFLAKQDARQLDLVGRDAEESARDVVGQARERVFQAAGRAESERRKSKKERAKGSKSSPSRMASMGGSTAPPSPKPPPVADKLLEDQAFQDEADLDEAMTETLPELLARLGYGALDASPEAWRHVDLSRPVYFENLYLGGNARLAHLEELGRSGRPATRIDSLLSPSLPRQLIDPPSTGGMALHVDLDRPSVRQGETQRVFLQVALKGSDALAWRRPPISLVVVFHVGTDKRAEGIAAAEALHEGLDRLDRLALVGADGRVRFLDPEQALELPERPLTSPDRLVDVLGDLSDAFETIETGGSLRNRRVLLITDRKLDQRVERAIHRLALKDVSTSVMSLTREERRSHAKVAMTGLGNLHFVEAAEVASAARDELLSTSRVVARALRLNIRPAPGVKLVQVLGSRPLNRQETRRVKKREKAIDRHVEKTLGIVSDRGKDDPGLQTIIPYFLGGDEHLVLVELEVTGPGPVADVSLKYKDLVDVKNRTLRQSAALSSWSLRPSRQQEEVSRNVLGFTVASLLRRAEEDLDAGRAVDLEPLRSLASALSTSSPDDHRLLRQADDLLSQPSATAARVLELARRARVGRSAAGLQP